MATQIWRNLAIDPKVVIDDDPLNPTISRDWGVGFENAMGTGYGDAAHIVADPSVPVAGVSNSAQTWAAQNNIVSASVGQNRITMYTATPGVTITVSIWAKSSVAGEGRVFVSVFDASGMSPPIATFDPGGYVAVAAGAWNRFSTTFTAPADGAYFTVNAGFRYATPQNGVLVSGAALSIVPNVGGLNYTGPYFDGDTADVPGVADYSWEGMADDSPSRLILTVPDPEPATAQSSAQVVPVPNPVITRALKPLYLKDFSVQEDSTPIYPSDQTGGAGTMTLRVDENGDTPYLLDAEIDIVDPAQGTTRGTIRGISSDNTDTTLSADSRMALLNVDRNAAPFVGTLGDALAYYYGLCGITDGYVVEESLRNNPVTWLGFSGNVWEYLKRAGATGGFEHTLVSNNIVCRPVRQNVAENYRDSSRSWSYNTSQKALSVEVYKYTVSQAVNDLVYNGYSEEQTPISVEAGTTQEFTIPFNGSIASLDQPTYTTSIGPGDPGFSAYNAIGQDNLPIPKAQWEDQGGSLTVRPSDDSRSIIVTVTAPYEAEYSPYRIGVSDGDTVYSTLRLHGSALLYEKELHTYHTAVDPDRVSQKVGATVDSEFIQTDQQLLDAAMGELRYWGGNRRVINVATRGINRLGDSGSYAYAEFSDFDAWWDMEHPEATFGDFDTEAPAVFGSTFGKHDEWWIEEVQDDFANQAFGNIAGARVYTDSNVHRIRTATTTPEGVSYEAWEDSVFSDHDALWRKINPPLGSIRNRIGNPDTIDGGTPFVANDSVGSYVPGFFRSTSSGLVSQQRISPLPPPSEVSSGRWAVVGGESQAIRVLCRSPLTPAAPSIMITPYVGSVQQPFFTSPFVSMSAGDTAVLEYRFTVAPDVTSISISVGAGATSPGGVTFDTGQWAFYSGADADSLDPLQPIPFFSGNTPATPYADYAWVGNPDESATVKTELNPATFADFDAHWFGRAFVEFDATPLEKVS